MRLTERNWMENVCRGQATSLSLSYYYYQLPSVFPLLSSCRHFSRSLPLAFILWLSLSSTYILFFLLFLPSHLYGFLFLYLTLLIFPPFSLSLYISSLLSLFLSVAFILQFCFCLCEATVLHYILCPYSFLFLKRPTSPEIQITNIYMFQSARRQHYLKRCHGQRWVKITGHTKKM